MISEKDIYRSAKAVIDKCEGHHDAKEYALFRVRKLYDDGDVEGAAVWQNIANAIDEINNMTGKGKPN